MSHVACDLSSLSMGQTGKSGRRREESNNQGRDGVQGRMREAESHASQQGTREQIWGWYQNAFLQSS